MGASQHLRSENLVETVRGYLTPDVTRGASSFLGESEPSTSHAMQSAVPGLLTGMLHMSSSNQGANSLAEMIRGGSFGSLLGNPSSLFVGGGQTSRMVNTGQSLVGRIFGNRASSITNAIASSSGVKPSSAGTLMSLLAPLTLGVIGNMAGPKGLNAAGISDLLGSQKREILDAAPSEVSHILGLGGGPVAAPTPSALYEEKERDVATPSVLYEEGAVPGPRKWLPWLLLGLVALGFLAYLLSRRPAEPPVASAPAPAPTAPVAATPAEAAPPVQAAKPSVADTIPAAAHTTTLHFQTGSTQLTAESAGRINNLATTLRAHPDTQVQVTGHTDTTGNPQSNQQLSVNRADAVKAMLVRDGISADRISASGDGQDRPIASNDNPEGRLKNRRTDVTVTNR